MNARAVRIEEFHSQVHACFWQCTRGSVGTVGGESGDIGDGFRRFSGQVKIHVRSYSTSNQMVANADFENGCRVPRTFSF